MADIILTLLQIEDFFQNLTMQILGIDPGTELSPKNQDKVRINWQPIGSPAWKREEDVVFIGVNTPDDPITYQRDVAFQELNGDMTNTDQKTSYTRVHSIKWTLYGPNSYDMAERIKNGLYAPSFKIKCANKNLYLIPGLVPPFRVPENFNGQWWQRADFGASFNEKVVLSRTIPVIESTNIIVKGD